MNQNIYNARISHSMLIIYYIYRGVDIHRAALAHYMCSSKWSKRVSFKVCICVCITRLITYDYNNIRPMTMSDAFDV